MLTKLRGLGNIQQIRHEHEEETVLMFKVTNQAFLKAKYENVKAKSLGNHKPS